MPFNRVVPLGGPPVQLNMPGFVLIQVPLWMFVAPALFVSLPIWIEDARRGRWRRTGRCERCGYDLAGAVEGPGKPECPECGAPRSLPVRRSK